MKKGTKVYFIDECVENTIKIRQETIDEMIYLTPTEERNGEYVWSIQKSSSYFPVGYLYRATDFYEIDELLEEMEYRFSQKRGVK